jgi:hypothetical protein
MLGYFRLGYIILCYDRSPSVALCYLRLSYKCCRVGFFKKQAVKLGNGCLAYALNAVGTFLCAMTCYSIVVWNC